MNARRRNSAHRLLGALDLAIDFATLGEYGLEPLPADGPCRERPGHAAGWEALAGPAAGSARVRRRAIDCVAADRRDAVDCAA